MKHGFVKVAAVTPRVKVADTEYNAKKIIEAFLEARQRGAKIIVFPELCITGYTCGDLFLQDILLKQAKNQLLEIAKASADSDALLVVGLPFEKENKIYNVAAFIQDGEIVAIIPKTAIPNYGEFYEARYFAKGNHMAETVFIEGEEIPFGTNILLECEELNELCIACEICEDLWHPDTPSTHHALAGATVIVNLSASNETVEKSNYRQNLVQSTSARTITAYIYASAGEGESTTDLVFGGHNMVAENGTLLAQSPCFENGILYAQIDVKKLAAERRKMNTFSYDGKEEYLIIPISFVQEDTELERYIDPMPFVPAAEELRIKHCEEVFRIQAMGLKKRYEHTGCKTAVIGISGGLDSTLALLAAVKTFELLRLDRKGIFAITMPCFGTTDRTYTNACELSKKLGVTLEEIDIKKSVSLHFEDIKQDQENHNITFENAQARERTQILMDIANRENALVIGTGDMSELALGWATYNGDHMSMYGVNAGVPKTMVRYLVEYYKETCNESDLKATLEDVLSTPVSPELLPPIDGKIAQETENLVGPYELHDFFLYYMLRFGFEPEKIFRMAVYAFYDKYNEEIILKWLSVFYKRFFSQQFKRSCLPDGPKVGSIGLSPRGDLRMPSDACARIWIEQCEKLKERIG